MPDLRTSCAAGLVAGLLSLSGCSSMQPHAMHPGMYAPGVSAYPGPMPQQSFVGPAVPMPSRSSVTTPTTTFAPTKSMPTQQAPVPLGNPGPSSAENPVPKPREPSAEAASPEEKTSSREREMGSSLPRTRRYEFGLPQALPSDNPEFVPPATVEQPPTARIAVTSPPPFASDINQVAFQNLSSHEPQFRWIQGVLQYDKTRKAWHLMYDAKPGKDPLGGEVTLTGHLPFTLADHEQLVRVHGHFHERLLDRLEKPQYVVERVDRIQPTDLE